LHHLAQAVLIMFLDVKSSSLYSNTTSLYFLASSNDS